MRKNRAGIRLLSPTIDGLFGVLLMGFVLSYQLKILRYAILTAVIFIAPGPISSLNPAQSVAFANAKAPKKSHHRNRSKNKIKRSSERVDKMAPYPTPLFSVDRAKDNGQLGAKINTSLKTTPTEIQLEDDEALPIVASSSQTYSAAEAAPKPSKVDANENMSEEDEVELPQVTEKLIDNSSDRPTLELSDSLIPQAFVSLGKTQPAYGIVVEKAKHQLHLFQLMNDGKYNRIKTYRAITGKDPGDKVAKGDLRTPEGIYFVEREVARNRLTNKYGVAAFTLDYPNIFDQRRRKSGNGIWIHATNYPNRLKNPYDTEGCVVVSNSDILELKKYIQPFKVPVVITKKMETTTESEIIKPREKALDLIENWRKSWVDSEFEDYMALYSENFHSGQKNKTQWEAFKKSLSEQREKNIHVTLSDIKILAFQDQLLVTFNQDYSSNQHADYGRKFVYLQWESDQYRIISEKWYPQQKVTNILSAEEKRPL